MPTPQVLLLAMVGLESESLWWPPWDFSCSMGEGRSWGWRTFLLWLWVSSSLVPTALNAMTP